MSLGAGGRIEQKIVADTRDPRWCDAFSTRVHLHIFDSATYFQLTGEQPPLTPVSEKTYREAGVSTPEPARLITCLMLTSSHAVATASLLQALSVPDNRTRNLAPA